MEEVHITIVPKMSISVAKFVKSKQNDYTYFAHPHTIKAMKNDALSSKELLKAEVGACAHCQQLLHIGIWNYCPICGR